MYETIKYIQEVKPVMAKKWQILLITAIIAPIGLGMFFGCKEPIVKIDTNAFSLRGLYGVNIPFTEIAETDTIVWSKMPAISIRTNGISFYRVREGDLTSRKFVLPHKSRIFATCLEDLTFVIKQPW